MSDLLAELRSGRVLLMDGAMGTQLQRAGLASPQTADDWNLFEPRRVRAVHRAYARAGADILVTNTFQSNPMTARERERTKPGFLYMSMVMALWHASEVADGKRKILLDIGPMLGKSHAEFDNPADLRLLTSTVRKAVATSAVHVAGVLVETCSTARVRRAVRALARLEMPVLLSLSFRRDARIGFASYDGHAPEWFAERAEDWGVAALGVNCGIDITVADCAAIVRRYRQACDVPLFARPNAGTPRRGRDRWIYAQTPRRVASHIEEVLIAGAIMIGGCCGTSPAHIAQFRKVIDRWNRSAKR